MNMQGPRWAITLVSLGGACGASEELVGDLLEELDCGRSPLWLCRQLAGLYGFAIAAQVRARVRLTPEIIALAMSVVLLIAASLGPGKAVIAAWLSFYYVMGALSLFAQMATHTIGAQADVDSNTVVD
jgi:hypothetical protein